MRFLLLLPLLISVNFIVAQEKDPNTISPEKDNSERIIKKKTSRADIHYQNANYDLALSNLKELVELTPDSAGVHYKMGLCYFNLNKDSLALDAFEKASALGEKNLPKINYYLAVSKQLNGLYEDALTHYKKEKATSTSGLDYIKEIDKHISECVSGNALLASKDTTIQLYNIGDSINTPYQESSIYFASDSVMYITSARPTKAGAISENIYNSEKREDTWSRISILDKPINTNGNDAVVGLANKGEKMFLYADVNGGDIYSADKKGAIWTKPVVFGDSINSTKMESSLCFSSDSTTVYFISNRDGSIGGKDIFYAVKEGSSWSAPLNMGSSINSEFDEESPFLLGDTLFFSSRGHTSAGGFDVFKSYKQGAWWIKPINLGFPVNSPYDELSYTILNNMKYVITDRPGGQGETDIYEIDLIKNRRPKAIIEAEREQLALKDSIESVFNDSLVLAEKASIKAAKAIEEKCKRFSSLNTKKSVDLIGLLNLKPVVFGFGKYSLSADSRKLLDLIIQEVKQCPDLNLEIRTHTDCRGSAVYNKQLSDKRALAIEEYIQKSNSLLAKRTKVLSFGESSPLIDCNCDGNPNIQKKCTLSEHIQNRRVEVKLTRDKSVSGNANDQGYYVVLASEGTEAAAKRKLKKMKAQRPAFNLMITPNLRKSWFHICVNQVYAKEVVSKKVAHYRGLGISDAWYIYVD